MCVVRLFIDVLARRILIPLEVAAFPRRDNAICLVAPLFLTNHTLLGHQPLCLVPGQFTRAYALCYAILLPILTAVNARIPAAHVIAILMAMTPVVLAGMAISVGMTTLESIITPVVLAAIGMSLTMLGAAIVTESAVITRMPLALAVVCLALSMRSFAGAPALLSPLPLMVPDSGAGITRARRCLRLSLLLPVIAAGIARARVRLRLRRTCLSLIAAGIARARLRLRRGCLSAAGIAGPRLRLRLRRNCLSLIAAGLARTGLRQRRDGRCQQRYHESTECCFHL